MEQGPTVFVIPKHLTTRASRLRAVVRAHVLLAPVAIWLPVLLGVHGKRVAVIGGVLLIILWLLLQIPAFGAPRTMRRRFRRITGQAGLAALAIFIAQALIWAASGRVGWLALGTLLFNLPMFFLLSVSLPVYLAARPEDTSRP